MKINQSAMKSKESPTYVIMRVHADTCVYMCIYMYACVYMCMHVYACVYMRLHLFTCAYMYVHVCTCTYMYFCSTPRLVPSAHTRSPLAIYLPSKALNSPSPSRPITLAHVRATVHTRPHVICQSPIRKCSYST